MCGDQLVRGVGELKCRRLTRSSWFETILLKICDDLVFGHALKSSENDVTVMWLVVRGILYIATVTLELLFAYLNGACTIDVNGKNSVDEAVVSLGRYEVEHDRQGEHEQAGDVLEHGKCPFLSVCKCLEIDAEFKLE